MKRSNALLWFLGENVFRWINYSKQITLKDKGFKRNVIDKKFFTERALWGEIFLPGESFPQTAYIFSPKNPSVVSGPLKSNQNKVEAQSMKNAVFLIRYSTKNARKLFPILLWRFKDKDLLISQKVPSTLLAVFRANEDFLVRRVNNQFFLLIVCFMPRNHYSTSMSTH